MTFGKWCAVVVAAARSSVVNPQSRQTPSISVAWRFLLPGTEADLKLIVEVDGEHHETDEGRPHDQRRDPYLAERAYHVVRIPG